MKKLIAHPVTWLLYYLGDLSYSLELPYSMYNKIMIWSLRVQEWGNLEEPWIK